MSFHLRTLFATSFAAFIILLTVLLSYFIGKESMDSMKHNIGLSLSDTAGQMAEKLDHFMWSRSGEVEVLSKLGAFREPIDTHEVDGLLNQWKVSLPVFTWIGYVDRTGSVKSATDGILVGENIAKRPVFTEGVKGPFIGDVHDAVLLAKLLPNPSGEPLQLVDFSFPVRGTDGQLSGVLAAHLSWSWAREVERSILEPLRSRMKETEIFIVSKKDRTVLLGPSSYIGKPMPGRYTLGSGANREGWSLVEDDQEYLAGHAYGDGYMNYPGLGWTVIVRQPAEVAFASVERLRLYILAVGLTVAFLFALAGWFLAGWISRPLRQIADTADRLSTGERLEIPEYGGIRDISVLSRSLRNLVNNLTHTESALDQMSEIARHDPLTGLPNRTALDDYLAQSVQKAKYQLSSLSFLYLDLDGFKAVNDNYGHDTGDKLLREVALRLLDCTREHEMVTRIGGDEFVVVLQTSAVRPEYEAETVAKRIINRINEPFFIGGLTLNVGVSIGAAVWRPEGADTSETLRLADEALYISKRSGKNRITFEFVA